MEIACKAGASGFMAGRALWQEATRASTREERLSFFESQTVARLSELAERADTWTVPWYAKMGYADGQFSDLAEDWYRSY